MRVQVYVKQQAHVTRNDVLPWRAEAEGNPGEGSERLQTST